MNTLLLLGLLTTISAADDTTRNYLQDKYGVSVEYVSTEVQEIVEENPVSHYANPTVVKNVQTARPKRVLFTRYPDSGKLRIFAVPTFESMELWLFLFESRKVRPPSSGTIEPLMPLKLPSKQK